MGIRSGLFDSRESKLKPSIVSVNIKVNERGDRLLVCMQSGVDLLSNRVWFNLGREHSSSSLYVIEYECNPFRQADHLLLVTVHLCDFLSPGSCRPS